MKKRKFEKKELVRYQQKDPNIKNYNDKEILLHLDSFCLGDTICFFSLIKAFLEFHKPRKLFVTTFFPELFELDSMIYPNVEIVRADDSTRVIDVDKMLSVGYDKKDLHHTLNGMFYAAKDTMRLPQTVLHVKPPMRKIESNKKNRASIAPESIKKIALWNYFGEYGWQIVVDYLVKNNFEVYNVSYEDNIRLKNVINFNKNDNLLEVAQQIVDSKIFIGLSSGLSWLAWAYDVPVVMISGFTKPHNEFECYRVYSEKGCSGCFNIFKNIKNKCPIFVSTERENECHKLISPDMVISKIKETGLVTQH